MNTPNEINWQQFIRENIEPKIKKDTLQSWKRSQSHKINPYMENLNSLTKLSFEKTPESKLFFNDIVDYLNRSLDENTTDESAWIFTNQDGIILKIRTNSEYFKQEMNDFGFKERISLAEDSIGTNAISMAMHNKERSICVEAEHYLKILHKYKAAANPVFNIEGTLMGYCMLIAKKHFIRTTTLNMMLLLMIEGVDKSFRLQRSRGRHDNLKDKVENALFENHLVPTVFLNNNGFIRHLNNSALELLEIDVDTRSETNIDQIADFTPNIREIARSGLETKNIELSIQTKSGKIINVCANRLPYYNKTGQFLGVSLQFFEKEKTQTAPKSTYTAKHTFNDIIGNSQHIKRAKEIALRVAETNINVLLIGPSGTGKETFAQSIHNSSDRKNGPFVSINCAAIQKESAEFELFGGFNPTQNTDALVESTMGKLESANTGTIFLDEIGDLSLEIQAKFLRILEERKLSRLGETNETTIDIRIIAATNKDLIEMVQKNEFREDLYYRLSVTSIQLPALKQSKEDIPMLLSNFLELYNEQMGKKVKGFKEDILERLMVYDWPGNIRELRNTVEFAIMLNQGSEFITWEQMPGNLRLPLLYNKKAAEAEGNDPLDKEREGISKSEIALIKKAIKISNGKMNEAAKILGVSRATIYRKIKKLGIPPFA